MEALVTTLETSKRLKAAGFPLTTFYVWNTASEVLHPNNIKVFAPAPAPTAQEIADQLPPRIQLRSIDQSVNWLAMEMGGQWVGGDSMAEALAQLYLKLKEAK